MPRHPTKLAAVVLVTLVALVPSLAGCGDDDGGDGGGDVRPSVEEVAEVLPAAGLSADQLDCLAEAFVASDISDDGLRAIVEGGGVDGTSGLSTADQAAVQAAAGEAVRCSAADAADDLPPVTG